MEDFKPGKEIAQFTFEKFDANYFKKYLNNFIIDLFDDNVDWDGPNHTEGTHRTYCKVRMESVRNYITKCIPNNTLPRTPLKSKIKVIETNVTDFYFQDDQRIDVNINLIVCKENKFLYKLYAKHTNVKDDLYDLIGCFSVTPNAKNLVKTSYESVLSIFKDKSIEIIKHISKILLNEFINYFNIKDICITVEKEFLISLIGKRLLKNGFGLKEFFSDQYKTYKSVLKAIGTDLKENGFKVSKNLDFILITEQEYYLSCLNRLAKLVIVGETTSVTYPGYMKDTPVYLVKISTKEEETKIMNLWKKYGDKNNVIKIKRVNVAENTYGITVYGNIKVSGTILQEARKQMGILLRSYISNMKNDE